MINYERVKIFQLFTLLKFEIVLRCESIKLGTELKQLAKQVSKSKREIIILLPFFFLKFEFVASESCQKLDGRDDSSLSFSVFEDGNYPCCYSLPSSKATMKKTYQYGWSIIQAGCIMHYSLVCTYSWKMDTHKKKLSICYACENSTGHGDQTYSAVVDSDQ